MLARLRSHAQCARQTNPAHKRNSVLTNISREPTLIFHCEEHYDVAISMSLNIRRRTAVATATRLPTPAWSTGSQ